MLLFAPLVTAQDDGETGRTAYRRTLERVRSAQRSGIDALLIGDRQAVGPASVGEFEAGTLAAALAVATEGIGLVTTISTEQLEPYHVARLLATIDYLSHGWAGWQSAAPSDDQESANYAQGTAGPQDRQLARAEEFAHVVTGLWDSFQDDAFLRDRESGVYFLPNRLRALDHKGEHFDVAGPLNIARPPQGHPVLARRLLTVEDAEFAGRVADIAVVPAERSAEVAEMGKTVRAAASHRGRAESDVRLLLEVPAHGADELFRTDAVDGFVLIPPPGSAEGAHSALVERAKALRSSTSRPADGSLRARLGLPRPPDRRRAV
ncbi:LLM class flavin-dependent oxidoreductase [Streptomyces sp. NBC_01233]|uniref:LLM class flavin-dependent oxidoreductase n=1 Tax=Streptomyces sp. NBC_01233 TaxID=2903787 RepID=UPI002E13B66C|nr:LLM class flavin-dependent oxidoreductase [Streptomyces sp. NBC_01233]